MYVADSRGVTDARGALRPGRRAAAIAPTVLALGVVSLITDILLQRRFDVPVQWFALLPLGTAAAFLTLTVSLGRLADRFGRWRVFIGGHVLLLGAYGLLLTPWHFGAMPYAVLAMHGTFYAATDGVLMAAAAATVPSELRSSGLALVQTGQATARFACSLAFGAAWSAWGDRSPHGHRSRPGGLRRDDRVAASRRGHTRVRTASVPVHRPSERPA
jgi:hypothetical protein